MILKGHERRYINFVSLFIQDVQRTTTTRKTLILALYKYVIILVEIFTVKQYTGF